MATLTTSYQLIANKLIGTVSGSGVSAKNIYLRIYAKYNSQSIVDNKSNVSYKSTLYVDGSGTYFYTGSTTTKTLSGTGATSVSADAQGNYNLGETTLSEITGTVTHGSNGAASVSITAGWVSAPWGISGSVTGTATLPTIARATTPVLAATTITMGATINITLTPANSTFKHKLRYDFGSVKGSASGFSMGAEFTAQGTKTVTFTPPTSLGSQIPNNLSGTGQIVCYTYTSTGAHIGTTYVKITLNVPSYTPTITGITLTGKSLLSSTYVQGKSSVTVNATVATSYGATIKSITSVIDGKTYSGLPFTTSVLSSGSKTAKITIVDTRNKSVTVESAAIAVFAYSAPSITAFHLARQADGTTVIASMSGSISPLNNKNTKSFTITLNGVTNVLTVSGYEINGSTTFTNVPTDSTLTATATIKDYYTTTKKEAILPTVAVTMDFYQDGKGIAMGKVAESSNLLDVAWDTKVGGALNVKKAIKTEQSLVVSSPLFGPASIERNDSAQGATLKFANSNGTLGFIGMSGEADTGLRRWTANSAGAYFVLDTGNTKDYVVDYNPSSSGWAYRLWNSGVSECWKIVSMATGTFSGTSPTFYCTPGTKYNYPSGLFTSVTDVQMTVALNGGGVITAFNCSGIDTTYCEPGFIRLYGGSASINVSVSIHVIGKWK